MLRCLLLLLCGLLAACGAPTPASDPLPEDDGGYFHIQLLVDDQHPLNTSLDVDVYDIDLFDSSAELIAALQARGADVICYFSAGSYENWRDDADEFPTAVLGNNLDGWPGEKWLDISNTALQSIMIARLDLAVDKGCDGVDPDNVDGYSNNTGFTLTAADQLAYNRWLADQAHARGLTIGLKNDLGQITDLVADFDFAVNEECFAYDECDLLSPFVLADKPVLHIEYGSEFYYPGPERDALCAQSAELGLQTLIMPDNLDGSFRIRCP